MDGIIKRLNYLEIEFQKIPFINQVLSPNTLFGSNAKITTLDGTNICNCANNESKKENSYDAL